MRDVIRLGSTPWLLRFKFGVDQPKELRDSFTLRDLSVRGEILTAEEDGDSRGVTVEGLRVAVRGCTVTGGGVLTRLNPRLGSTARPLVVDPEPRV